MKTIIFYIWLIKDWYREVKYFNSKEYKEEMKRIFEHE